MENNEIQFERHMEGIKNRRLSEMLQKGVGMSEAMTLMDQGKEVSTGIIEELEIQQGK